MYQLTFFPVILPVNCYLVEEKDGLTLIDAALTKSGPAIRKAAEQIGKPITRIMLTHAHGDHVGALDELKQTISDAEVYISRRDSRLLSGDGSLERDEPQTPIRGIPKGIKTLPDVLLEDGDRIGSLTAISSPGHTPGSMSFLDQRSGVLIAGDAFQLRGGIAVAGKLRPMFPFPAMATWDKRTACESARKLVGYNPSLLAVGHGNMLENPTAAMLQAIDQMERAHKRAE